MTSSHKNAVRNRAVHFAIESVTLDMSLFHGYRIVLWHLYCVWNVMAHAQKPDFVFRRNGRVHLNWRGRLQSTNGSRGAHISGSNTTCSEAVWRVLATHSIRQFPLHFPSRASPCATTFQLDSTFSHPAVLCGQSIINPKYNGIPPPPHPPPPNPTIPVHGISEHLPRPWQFVYHRDFQGLLFEPWP